MARPQRQRRICREPDYLTFSPDGVPDPAPVILTLDEFEVLRLVDLEGQTHEQAAGQMEISRSTATEIYESARRKIADSLVNGHRLTIAGGSYRLCDGSASGCPKRHCHHRSLPSGVPIIKKGGNSMRIAVTYENGNIFQHFGHTAQFKLYDVENGVITASQVVDTNGSGHGALAGFLAGNQVDVLICGGIGGGAQAALAKAGIQLYGGVSGSADEAVKALAAGKLSFDPDVHCDHHDHEHGAGGHTCGEHGCGSHNCG